nr:hypothetical protein [Candidatus Gracilibacteria bacterium]
MKINYPLYEGLFLAEEKLKEIIRSKEGNIVVLVAGGSASGKTSMIAKKIYNTYKENAVLLSMDNYYRGKDYYEKYNLNYDQPEALNLDLFFEHLEKLKNGESVRIPEYDFVNSRPILNAIEIEPKKIIIIEGLFALHDKLVSLGDYKIFVDLGTHGRILRRIFRDVERTGQRPKDILEYFLETVEPMNEKYIEPTKENADIIISNEYIPFVESRDTHAKDLQMKFDISGISTDKISDVVLRRGGQYFGASDLIDYFFSFDYGDSKKDFDNEIIFIRRFEFGKYLFTYKGPLKKGEKAEFRYNVSFFVDADVLEAFRKIYGNDMKILSRKRHVYYINANIFCIDNFENGKDFVEVKFYKYTKKEKKVISNIFKELCLDLDFGVCKFYVDLL